MFDQFARPYEERLVKDLTADGIFVVIHICGDTSRILDSMADYDPAVLSSTTKLTREGQTTAGKRHVLFGNIDPSGVLANGTVEEVRSATRGLIRHGSRKGVLF